MERTGAMAGRASSIPRLGRQWIGFDRRFPWDGDPQGSRLSARYFRKEFDCDKEIRSATAYIIGLGFYEFRINGRKIGDGYWLPYRPNLPKT